jgi:hypothetical protein
VLAKEVRRARASGLDPSRARGTREAVDHVRLRGVPVVAAPLWIGPEWRGVELLSALPDDAGAEAVWRALSA